MWPAEPAISRFASLKLRKQTPTQPSSTFNGSMLEVGQQRARTKKIEDQLTFVEANAEDLPFEDNTFDAYTIAFWHSQCAAHRGCSERGLQGAETGRPLFVS